MRWVMIFLIVLAGCAVPIESNGDAVQTLKDACNAACGGEKSATVALLEGSKLYTTSEAICIARVHDEKSRLFCGTCTCENQEAGRYGPTPNLLYEGAGSVTCTFSDTGASVDVSC